MNKLERLSENISAGKVIVTAVLLVSVGVGSGTYIIKDYSRRVNAVESTQEELKAINQDILNRITELGDEQTDKIDALKDQQTTLTERVAGIDRKSTETNKMVRELLNLFKPQ